MGSAVASFVALWTDAIFPRRCVACRDRGRSVLCAQCLRGVPAGPETAEDHVVWYAYANPAVRLALQAAKYDGDQSGIHSLLRGGEEREALLREFAERYRPEAVVPIPLVSRKERTRGYNQVKVIAERVALITGLPLTPLLERTGGVASQVGKTDAERQEAMKLSPFRVKKGLSTPNCVLLVDDVWTTGATLVAATSILKGAGVQRVVCFTLAAAGRRGS